MNLQGGDTLGVADHGQQVVAEGVRNVLGPVGVRALLGDLGLGGEAEHGNHGEAAVLDLLHAELSERIGVVSQTEGVELATGVQLVEVLNLNEGEGDATGALVGRAVALNEAQEDNVERDHDDQGERDGNTEEVEEATVEHGRAGLPPHGTVHGARGEGVARLGHDAANGGNHRPATVEELVLAVGGQLSGVLAQAKGIVAVVTGELTVEVSGDILRGQEAAGK
eukprot:3219213-Pyramimonas_sp.AAC.1